jgi:hypothetical protein
MTTTRAAKQRLALPTGRALLFLVLRQAPSQRRCVLALAAKMKTIRLWNFFCRAGLIVRLPQ